MATGKTGLGIKNKGLLVFGIVLLVIGLVATLYRETVYGITISQPYLGIGIILVLAGIIFVALGFLYPPRQIFQTPTSPLSVQYCPTCGQQLTFIQQYGRWYCPKCRNYSSQTYVPKT